jgi:hypothetical protein
MRALPGNGEIAQGNLRPMHWATVSSYDAVDFAKHQVKIKRERKCEMISIYGQNGACFR